MSFITLKCKNCGSQMSLNTESHSATCTHCGSTFLLADLLDEQDLQFASSISGKDLEKKMYAGEELKKGETCLYQANYEEAEQHFKKAIEYDDKNHRAYLGVVKAKTQNLNVIPETDDYLQYAKYAMRYATFEDEVYVKSELAKIELLKREDLRQRKAKRAKARHEEYKKNKKKQINKFFTKITILISILFIAGILIGNYLFQAGWDGIIPKRVYISTTSEFIEKFYDKENTSANFYIKEDLDFTNVSIPSAVGSSSKPFSGKVYGNGHTIKNVDLPTNVTGLQNCYGLFGYLSNATITDLVLDNITLNAQNNPSNKNTSYYGILAGYAYNSVIKNIKITKSPDDSNTELIVMNGNLENLYIGGLVGKISFGTKISNVSIGTELLLDNSNLTSVGNLYIGGIVGYVDKSTVTASMFNGSIITSISNSQAQATLNHYVGGIAGCLNNSIDTSNSVTKNIFAGSLKINEMNVSRIETYLGSIVGYGSNFEETASNYCYLTISNPLEYQNVSMTTDMFRDYNTSFTTFTNSKNLIHSKLIEYFDSSVWTVNDLILEFKK